MYLATVIPITRGIAKEELSYFTSNKITVGTFVRVPLRKKIIDAIVTDVEAVKKTKALLRRAPFTLRKIQVVRTIPVFTEAFLKAAEKTAHFHTTTTGDVIAQLLPKTLPPTEPPRKNRNAQKHTCVYVQGTTENRFLDYKNHIVETEKLEKITLFVSPTIAHAERNAQKLTALGFENILIHSEMPVQTFEKNWRSAIKMTHAIVVGTSQILSLPRNDVGLILLEQVEHSGFKTHGRHVLDIRRYAHNLARALGTRFIAGDILLSLETRAQCTASRTHEYPYNFKSNIHIGDAKQKKQKHFTLLEPKLTKLIEDTKSSRLFVFVARRGIAGITACRNCGTLAVCSRCDTPVILHEKKGGRSFRCHRCGKEEAIIYTCSACGGWDLLPLGAGVAGFRQEIQKRFPSRSVFEISSDNTKTRSQIKKTLDRWHATEGGILVGTSQVLPYLDDIPHIAIGSLDVLFGVPDWSINEKIAHLLLLLREKASETLLLETRHPEHFLFSWIQNPESKKLLKTEQSDRKKFDLPPFSTLIGIRLTGNTDALAKTQKRILRVLDAFTVHSFPEKQTLRFLIKVPKKLWPNMVLMQQLKEIAPYAHIEINPTSLYW